MEFVRNMPVKRNRLWYTAAAAAVIVLGLASREITGLFPPVLGKYPGDALWALLVFLLLGIARPSWSTPTVALLALTVSFLDEFSQLYQAPWINAIRETGLGHIILGSAFSRIDLIAYTIGITFAALPEYLVFRWPRRE
jgi:hypothetical protein